MGRYRKILMIVMALSSLVLWGYLSVRAQPFGIMSPRPEEEPQQKILSCASGRFAFGQISDSSEDQFMLDTFSGRLWRIAESGAVGIFLRTVPYRTAEGKYSPFPKAISESTPRETETK